MLSGFSLNSINLHPQGWRNVQKTLGAPQSFLKSIEDFDYEKIPQETRAKALNKVSNYSHEIIKNNSKAVAIFYDWVRL
jgi:hypothetical protein